jgi:dipeptidyl aminopeptidase/acylaminoacyl peptidase
MRRAILLLGGLFASALCAQPATRPVELDDLNRVAAVSEPQISPDGRRVIYSVRTVDAVADRGSSDLWMAAWDGSENRRLTFGKESESQPRWSPDGRRLAFLSSRGDDNGSSQLWLLPVGGGGEAEKVTELTEGIDDYAWAPDGKRVVLVVTDADPDDAEDEEDEGPSARSKKAKATKKPIVVDRYQFKLDGYGYLGSQRSHLRLLDLETRKVEPLTSGEYDELQPAWSPDGKWVAFVSKRGPDPDRTDNWDLYVIAPRSGETARRLTDSENSDNQPDWGSDLAWSPDSRFVAYLEGGPDKLIYYAVQKLAVVPVAGGPRRVLTESLDRNVNSPRFSADGSSILFLLEDDQSAQLAKIPASGGAIQRLTSGRRIVSAFSLAADGRTTLLSTTPTSPREAYALEPAGLLRPLSRQNDAWLKGVRLGDVEETRFRSKDGTEIHGFVVKPPDYQPGRKYPALLDLHGGPVAQFENGFDLDWQIFAANGWVVIGANCRGSSGRGEKFQSAIYAAWGQVDVEDVLAAVDDAVARGIADPEQLAVGGWSYGGMLTNYVIASTPRFKAASSGAGSANIFTAYGVDQYIREYEQELGPPWKNPAAWMKVSYPFFEADRITTPTLYMCGQEDFNMPLVNSEQMYQVLRSRGVPTQLVIYPGQGHGIRRPSYVRDRLERYLAWYGKYAKTAGASAPAAAAAP